MDEKDKKILEMLQENRTYKEIQDELHVSPTKIAQVKRRYQTHYPEGDLHDSSTGSNSGNSSEIVTMGNDLLINNQYFKHKNSSQMETAQVNSSNPEIALELRRMELEHEREMERMRQKERERDREHENIRYEQEEEALRQQITLLKRRNEKLMQENEDLRRQVDDLQDELNGFGEDTITELNEGIRDEYVGIVTDYLAFDENYVEEDELESIKSRVTDCIARLEKWCEQEGVRTEDYEEAELLRQVADGIGELLEQLSKKWLSSSIYVDFTEESYKMLQESTE